MGFLYDFLVGGRGIFQIYWRKFVNNSSNIIFIFLYLLKWFFNKKECLYVLLKFIKLRPFCRKMTEISYFSMPLTYLKKKKKRAEIPVISYFWVSHAFELVFVLFFYIGQSFCMVTLYSFKFACGKNIRTVCFL